VQFDTEGALIGTVTVIEHVTLDGVMQAPGRTGDDRRDGFEHGGWAHARTDEVMGRKTGAGMARAAHRRIPTSLCPTRTSASRVCVTASFGKTIPFCFAGNWSKSERRMTCSTLS
jgi:hypothetical protein